MRHEDEQDAGEGLTGCPTAGRRPDSVSAAPFWIPPSCRAGRSGFWWCGCSRTGRSDRWSGCCWSTRVVRRGIRRGGGPSGIGGLTGPGRETAREHRSPGGGRSHERRSRMEPPCAVPGVDAAAPLDQLSHGGWSRCCDDCTSPRWGLPQPRALRAPDRGPAVGLAGQLPGCTGVRRYRPRQGSTRVAARRRRALTKMRRRTRSVSPRWGPYVALAKATGIRLTAVLRPRGEHLLGGNQGQLQPPS